MTTTAAENTTTTRDELVRRAAELVPLLRKNAERCEQERQVPRENVDALVASGILRMTLPRRYGGYEADTHTKIAVVGELAKGCGSTAWVAGLWTDGTLFTSLFPDSVQDEVFADPDIRITVSFPTGGVAGERVDGGWRIGGRWPFNTGCAHAEWAVRSAIVEVEPGQPELGVFLVPYSEMEVADDWRTSGLAGTGSHTALGTDIFVPAERMLRFAAIRAGEHASAANAASPLYRTPMVSVILTTGSTTLPGLAKAALEVFLAKLPGKGITFTTYADGSQASIRHHQAAEAAMRIKAADHLTFELADIVDRHAATGEPYAPDEHPMLWANVAYATQLYSEAIEILRRGCGAHGILTSHPIHRIARDAEALTVHAIMAPTSGLEFYGRVLCGLPPNSPML